MRGSASTPGVVRAPPRTLLSSWRTSQAQKPAECLGYGRKEEKRCCQQTRLGVGAETVWLPKNRGFQRPLRPTVGVCRSTAPKADFGLSPKASIFNYFHFSGLQIGSASC